MKKILTISLILALLISCTTTTTTTITSAWKISKDAPKKYKKLAILAMLPNLDTRTKLENILQDELSSKGIRARGTWSFTPFAGDAEMKKKLGYVGEKLRDVIRKKTIDFEIDGLLIITLLDAIKEERYVEGTSVGFSTAFATDMGGGMYGLPYYDYYSYVHTVSSTPGYYEDASTFFVETNLYDVATEKLVWSAQTTTKDLNAFEKEAEKYAKLIVSKMLKDKALIK